MYWYISFLRPPPVSVSVAVGSIIVTPQVANDLRTELRYDPTPISYIWQRTSPSSPCSSTLPQQLTTFIPPASTYLPLNIPLPSNIKSGEQWRLGLYSDDSSPTGNGEGKEPSSSLLELSGKTILGVWSEPIHIQVALGSETTPGPVRGVGAQSANGGVKGKGIAKNSTNGNSAAPSRGKGKGKGKEKDEGPKQGRIWREWNLNPTGDDQNDASSAWKLRIIEQTSFDLDKKIWDSGLALSYWLYEHLTRHPTQDQYLHPLVKQVIELLLLEHEASAEEESLNILELGSGTGLVSIAMALAYTALKRKAVPGIIATDLESAIPLMDENLSLNGLSQSEFVQSPIAPLAHAHGDDEENIDGDTRTPSVPVRVQAKILDWDQPLPSWVDRNWPRLIVAADVTYNTSSFPSLLRTLVALLKSPSNITTDPPLLLLAYKQRDLSERELWVLLEKNGVTMVKIDEIVGSEGKGGEGTIEIWLGGFGLVQ